MSDQSITSQYINILRNLPFEIIAVQQDRYGQYSAINNSANQSFTIKIKRKRDTGMKCAAISIPKLNTTCNAKNARAVNSDQTIISFDLIMDTRATQNQKRHQNKFFHIFKSSCLRTQNEDESCPYTSSIKLEKIKNLSNDLKDDNTDVKLKNPLSTEEVSGVFATNPPKSFLGQCKPGGCLDPPYGEDHYLYKPTVKSHHESLKANNYKKINQKRKLISVDDEIRMTNNSEAYSDELLTNELDNSELSKLINNENRDNLENTLITYPHVVSNGKSSVKEDKQNCNTKSRNSLENRSSVVNRFPMTYYMPPKRSKTMSTELKYNKYEQKKITSDIFKKINIEIIDETPLSTSSLENRLTLEKVDVKTKLKEEIVTLPGIKQEIVEVHSKSSIIKLNEDTYVPKLDDTKSLNTTKMPDIDSNLLNEDQNFQTLNINEKDELETFKISNDIRQNSSIMYKRKCGTKEKLINLSAKISLTPTETTIKDSTMTDIKDLHKNISFYQHPSTDNLRDKLFDSFSKTITCQDINVLYEDKKLLDISPITSQDISIENNENNLLDYTDNNVPLNMETKYRNKNNLITEENQPINRTILTKKNVFLSKFEDELNPTSIREEIKLNTNDNIKIMSNSMDSEKMEFKNKNDQVIRKSEQQYAIQSISSLELFKIIKDDTKNEENNSSQNLSKRSFIKKYNKISSLDSVPRNSFKDSKTKTRTEIFNSITYEKKLNESNTTIIQNEKNVDFKHTDTGAETKSKDEDKVTLYAENIQTEIAKNEQATTYENQIVRKGVVNKYQTPSKSSSIIISSQLEADSEENKLNYENAKDIFKNTVLKDIFDSMMDTYEQNQNETHLEDKMNSSYTSTPSTEKRMQSINIQKEFDTKVDSVNALNTDVIQFITPLREKEIIDKRAVSDNANITSRKQSIFSLKECEKDNFTKETSNEINLLLQLRDIQSDDVLSVREKNNSKLNNAISILENQKSFILSLHSIQVKSEAKNIVLNATSGVSFSQNSEKEHGVINKSSQELEENKCNNLGAKNQKILESAYVHQRLTDVLDQEKDSSTLSHTTYNEPQENLSMPTISSLTVNLGFRTAVDNENTLNVQTYDPTLSVTKTVQDYAKPIEAIIKESDEIRISKKATPNKRTIEIPVPEEFEHTQKIPNSEKILSEHTLLQEMLKSVYEILVSIQDIFRNLSEEASLLSQQQMFFAQILNKMETKPLRTLNTDYRCECKKK